MFIIDLTFYPYSCFPCYTGTWSRGSNMPTDIFTYSTKIPEYCVVDDKLIIYTLAHIFIYCTKHDTWTEADIFNNRFKIEEPACFIGE